VSWAWPDEARNYLVQFAIIVLLFCTAIAVPAASVMLQFS
jgi:hypothetical protein